MELILLRHGKAEPHGQATGDAGRALVAKGRAQAVAAARLLKRAGLLPEIVLSSPLVRARQTAEEFCAAAGMPGPVVQPWLALGAGSAVVLGELGKFGDFQRVMIVGHEPDFSSIVEACIGAAGCAIDFKKGAIAAVRIDPPRRGGSLLYLVPPRLTDPDL